MIPGVDVSQWQGPPPWRDVSSAIDFAGVKFSELQPGGVPYINPDAITDWEFLREHSKGRVAYLFGHPSVSIDATVALFEGELAQAGLRDDDAVGLDLEVTDGLSVPAVNTWAAMTCRRLEREFSRPPLVYTYLDFARAGNCASLARWPLWVADPSSPRGHPRIPGPWRTWAVHQWSTSGAVDRDVADYPSLTEMAVALGKHAPPGETVEIGGPHATKTLYQIAAQYGLTEEQLVRLNPELARYVGSGEPVPVRTRIRV